MQPNLVLGVALLGASLVGAGCAGAGEDRTDAELTADVASALQEAEPGLTDDGAECWAELIVEEVGGDPLRDLDLTADSPPPELEEDLARAALAARADCELDG